MQMGRYRVPADCFATLTTNVAQGQTHDKAVAHLPPEDGLHKLLHSMQGQLVVQAYLFCRLKLFSASAAEAACRSPWVRAPSCCKRQATADAKRCSPEMSVLTMRYLGGCSWLDLCVRPSCCTCDNITAVTPEQQPWHLCCC